MSVTSYDATMTPTSWLILAGLVALCVFALVAVVAGACAAERHGERLIAESRANAVTVEARDVARLEHALPDFKANYEPRNAI